MRVDARAGGLAARLNVGCSPAQSGGGPRTWLRCCRHRERTSATEHTPYPIASLTKTYAAAVIMRLVEAGKLDLDEAMSTYDPGYVQWCAGLKASSLPSARNYNCDSERITVRHHLTHTAQGKPGTAYDYNGFLFARLTAVIVLLACTDRASSVFFPGNGDPLRTAFVTAFLDSFGNRK